MYPLALHYSCSSAVVEGTKWAGIHAEDYDLYRGPLVKKLAGPFDLPAAPHKDCHSRLPAKG